MRKDFVILLTACVNPNGMSFTYLQDKDIRLKQYEEALEWYLRNTQYPIVFVENTGYDITCRFEAAIISGRLEVLTFQGNNYDRSKGKGYGEALIIQYAITNSQLLKKASIIIKITGRLKISNLKYLLKEIRKVDTVYVKFASRKEKNVLMFESFFFAAPSNFFDDYFLKHIDEIDDSKLCYFEKVLYDTVIEWRIAGHKQVELLLPILVDGVSGSTGRAYETSRCPYLMSFVKWIYHKFPLYQRNRL